MSKLQVPCGGCLGCRLDRARNWQNRIMHEKKYHELSCFLTLTYKPENIPAGGSLVKKHMQDFWKRLRKKHGAHKIRYFMCGEYGDQNGHPHYHAIVFGLDFADKRKHSVTKRGDQIWVSEILDQLWGFGFCFLGQTTHESAGYVARYIMKKVTGEQADEHYKKVNTQTGEITNIQPEYIAMSQGLGRDFFDEHKDELFRRDSVIVKGKQNPLPKYYDKKMEELDPDRIKKVKRKRKQRAKKDAANNTPDRLMVREEIKKSKISTLARNL